MTTFERERNHPDSVGYDPVEGTYHLQHDWSDSASLTYTLLTGIAAITGDESHEIDVLTDTVDPDALNRLFARSQLDTGIPAANLTIEVEGCRVTVFPDGHVVLEPRDA